MSPDQFDDLITRHLGDTAPREAPGRVLDRALDRVAETPQRGRGWHLGSAGGLLAAAAVFLLAVVAGTQLGGLINRPVGVDPSPSASPLVTPSEKPMPSASPSVEPAPVSPSTAPSAAVGTEPATTDDGLLLRIVSTGGGPTDPASVLPGATVMTDGTMVWQPADATTDFTGFVTRTLTPDGLEQLREHIFGNGLLDAGAAHELEPLPGAEPPGRGVVVHAFTAGEGEDQVVVTSVQWLGDEEEGTYYQPAPAREALDLLARELRDPEALLDEAAWEGPAVAYEARDYQLVLRPYRDVAPYGNPDVAEVPIPGGSVDAFGAESGVALPAARCGIIGRDEAVAVIQALTELGIAETHSVAVDRATLASLDWAAGNGVVDLYLLPRMPDGYPACEDQP